MVVLEMPFDWLASARWKRKDRTGEVAPHESAALLTEMEKKMKSPMPIEDKPKIDVAVEIEALSQIIKSLSILDD